MSASSQATLVAGIAAIPQITPAPEPQRPWVNRLRSRGVLATVGLIAFVAIWKAAQASGLGGDGTVPDPFAIPGALLAEWQAGRLQTAVESSLIHYAWGLALGTLLGCALGAAAALSTLIDQLLSGVVRVLRPIPPLAWVIFAIAWFQISHEGAAFVIGIGVFWVNFYTTHAAVRGVEPRYYELARAFGQSGRLRSLLDVTLPAAAPGILAGVQTGIGAALMALIAAELIGMPGIGQEMNVAAGVGDYATVAAYMLVISAIYAVFDAAFVQLEKRATQWRPS
ncbi:MAG: ABC transporter permease subunit [Comamonas sp.]|nr:ABC transporter permease subunit [Comamonas sp.]